MSYLTIAKLTVTSNNHNFIALVQMIFKHKNKIKTRWRQNNHFYYSYQNGKSDALSYSIRWSVTKEEETRVSSKRGSRPEASNTTFAFQQSSMQASRSEAPNTRSFQRQDKSRLFNGWDPRLHQQRSRLLLPTPEYIPASIIVQQYTGKSNWQLYLFNSTPTNKSELR